MKHAVYRPDWTEAARLEHTLELARLLHALLPDDAEQGTISTLPLAWREPWPTEAHEHACAALRRLAEGLPSSPTAPAGLYGWPSSRNPAAPSRR